LGVVFIVVISVPYLWAYENLDGKHHFGGFLLNPIDGNSYFAKMYQGWQGSWKFTLPYTSEPGSGAYLFLFYLALGNIARLLSESIPVVFHTARIIGSLFLVISLWNFYRQTLSSERSRWLAYGLALFGSGIGWLAASYGLFTADFWVAEGYPFLSAYSNPHFPIGLAILIWLLSPNETFYQKSREIYPNFPEILWLCLTVLLALILPFGIVVTGVILGGYGLWDYVNRIRINTIKPKKTGSTFRIIRNSESWWKLFFILLGGLPMMIYQLWVTQSNPQLAAWNAQNLTSSPAIWDLILSYSPIILLAIPGAYLTWKSQDGKSILLLVWAILGLLLLYFPWNLQRRFILGYMIPLAGLAAIGLDRLFDKHRRATLVLLFMMVLLIVPTNLMIIIGGIQAVNIREPKLILSHEEMEALDWIVSNTNQDALILASPQMSLFIPAYTGRRVLYGHPFETVDAKEMEAAVEDFFIGRINLEDLPINREVDLIFNGPREREFGELDLESEYQIIYFNEGIQIFENTDRQKTSSIDVDQ
jgi:hypothetical protein